MARKKANGKAKASDRTADPDADPEQDVGHAPVSAKADARFTAPVRVVFTHYRKRLADLDNLCGKAVLDAIVRSDFLSDDSAQQVTEITHRQFKAEVERTVVEIEEV